MKIGTIRGISIKLHISTLLIVALVGFYAASFYYAILPTALLWELITVGIISGFSVLFSILLHELMHSFAAQKYGIKVPEIELYVFGGASKIEEEPKRPREEVVIAAVGPLSSLILGGFLLILALSPLTMPAYLFVILFYLGFTNISLAIFNFLPAFPMDGGRILRAFLWNKRKDIISATRTASRVGIFFGYALMIFGVFELLFFGLVDGLWLIVIGSFLSSAARTSYIQTVYQVRLSQFKAKDILSSTKWSISFYSTIESAIRDYFIPLKQSYFPVERDGKLVGIIHLVNIRKIPINKRSIFQVGDIMTLIEDFPTITEDQTGEAALKEISRMEKQPHIVVVKEIDNETIVGFIGEEELQYSLKLLQVEV